MRTFTQRPTRIQERSFRIARSPSVSVSKSARERAAGAPTMESRSLAHDFSRLPLHPSRNPPQALAISEPGDVHEQEADRAADAVMAGHDVQPSSFVRAAQPRLYRRVMRPEDLVDSVYPPGEEPEAGTATAGSLAAVHRSAAGSANAPGPRFQESLSQGINRGGEQLPTSTRSFMEQRFGRDFSAVRVHRDEHADALARHINARAFTIGHNLFFARSEYQPDRSQGQHLLAHELAHVVQQSSNRVSRQIQRQTRCVSFNGYDGSINLGVYNCAGLAIRTYQYLAPSSVAYDAMAPNLVAPRTPVSGYCDPGDVKLWFWEYSLGAEDDQGNVVAAPSPDFHVVGGRINADGSEPTNVYSKNGRRPVYGPGTGPSFRPPARERATSNDAHETPISTPQGRPVFKVRTNMREDITCAGCHP